MTDPAEVVRSFHERMQARDWEAADRYLSPTVHIEYSETGERFDGPNFLAMNRTFPEGWSITVVETVVEGDRVAAQVRVDHGENVFWCAGFYTVTEGVIAAGTEHWVTADSQTPPEWRRPFTTS